MDTLSPAEAPTSEWLQDACNRYLLADRIEASGPSTEGDGSRPVSQQKVSSASSAAAASNDGFISPGQSGDISEERGSKGRGYQ